MLVVPCFWFAMGRLLRKDWLLEPGLVASFNVFVGCSIFLGAVRADVMGAARAILGTFGAALVLYGAFDLGHAIWAGGYSQTYEVIDLSVAAAFFLLMMSALFQMRKTGASPADEPMSASESEETQTYVESSSDQRMELRRLRKRLIVMILSLILVATTLGLIGRAMNQAGWRTGGLMICVGSACGTIFGPQLYRAYWELGKYSRKLKEA